MVLGCQCAVDNTDATFWRKATSSQSKIAFRFLADTAMCFARKGSREGAGSLHRGGMKCVSSDQDVRL